MCQWGLIFNANQIYNFSPTYARFSFGIQEDNLAFFVRYFYKANLNAKRG